MITFSRTLLVGGEFLDEETLRFHGILEDNIYAMELQVEVGIGDGRILRIRGRMKRYTTPVCPKAVAFLQKAVGISLREEDWVSKVNREVGQKGMPAFRRDPHRVRPLSGLRPDGAGGRERSERKSGSLLPGSGPILGPQSPRSAGGLSGPPPGGKRSCGLISTFTPGRALPAASSIRRSFSWKPGAPGWKRSV